MRWCRLYAEFATDPKVQIMPEVMQRRLIMLFCFQADGCLEGMDDETLGFAMHVNATELQKTKELFAKKGFVEEGTWIPRNWEKRQRVSDDSGSRVSRYRERKTRDSNGTVTLQKLSGNGENETRVRGRVGAIAPSPSVSVSESESEGGPGGNPESSPDSPEHRAVIELAAQRWGASNGDAVVADLLRTFEPALVRVSMDEHWDKHGKVLKPALLRGKCQGKASDGWTPEVQVKAKRSGHEVPYRSKVVDAPLPPSARIAAGPSIPAEESMKLWKRGAQ